MVPNKKLFEIFKSHSHSSGYLNINFDRTTGKHFNEYFWGFQL
jgi:hypothetical protein